MVDFQKLKKSIFYIIFLIFLFFYPNLAFSQQSTDNQAWFCAKTTWCAGENYQQGTCTLNSGHRVRLEIDPANRPLANNNKTYLVECLSSISNDAPDFRCTTGSRELDIKAFGADNYTWLKNTWGYSLDRDENYGIFNVNNNQATKISPVEYKTGPSGGLIIKESNSQISVIEWQSYIPEEKSHKFYFFQKIPPQSSDEVGQGGQQQATSFDWINADRDCAVIRWDPAGRVFDALSLEPVPKASVFLTKDDGKGNFVNASQFEIGIINPQFTNPQGGFSFYVSDGDYKLNINNITILGYQRRAADINEINSKYNQIYYYLVSDVKQTFIYPSETGEVIRQRGKMEYRDIPLIPVDGQGKSYPLKVLSAFYTVDKFSKNAIFEGSVSHPFVRVIIYGVLEDLGVEKNKEMIYQGITDNFGNYKIIFSQSAKDRIYKYFETEFIKTPLTNISKNDNWLQKTISWILREIRSSVLAQTTSNTDKVSVRLDPIPTYLEGVARDSVGNILPNSQVKIYIKGMNVPYTVVNTDSQGYFKVPSRYLPIFPYEIKYQDSLGKIMTVSTSKFIADNRNLISSKKINLYSLKDSQGSEIKITPKRGNLFDSSRKGLTSVGNKTKIKQISPTQAKENLQLTSSPGVVLILATIFFLLIIIGVIIYFYWRQKQSSSMVG